MLAFLTPSLELAWSASTADAEYQFYPEDRVESLSDAYFQTEAWEDNGFAQYYYYSQSGPPDPNAQLDAFSEADASATGRVYLSPDQSSSGAYAGFGYAEVDIGLSFAKVRSADAQSNSDMTTKFVVEADANDPEGSLVNVRFTLSTYTEGIGSTSYSLTGPGINLQDQFATTNPNAESPVTQRTETFQVTPGEELTLSWHVATEGSAPNSDSSAHGRAYIRVGLQVVAPDLVVDGIAWNTDTEEPGGVVFSHTVYEAPLTRATSVSLFWSSTPDPSGIIGNSIWAKALPVGFDDSATEIISPDTLGEPPAGATYLLAFYDRFNFVVEGDEQNNFKALSLRPDLFPSAFYWLQEQREVGLEYTIELPKLANSPTFLETSASIQVYWANQETPIGAPIYKKESELRNGDYGPLVITVPLGPAPSGATGLIAIVDEENRIEEGNEENNELILKLPDLVGDWWDWNVERDNDGSMRGLDFAYYVNDADSKKDVEVEFYWAKGPQFTSRILPAAGKRVLKDESDEGYHGVFNEPARWGVPPVEATHILFVVDPLNKIKESDENNNLMSIPLRNKGDVFTESINFEAVDTKILGSFMPGVGNITLSEAEVILGVDHFNWVQEIMEIPEHWEIVHNPTPSLSQRVDLPMLDPLDYIDNTNEIVVVDLDLARGERMADDRVDSHKFYYNERIEVQRFTSVGELRFSDEPQFPDDFLLADEFVKFRLRLAGVSYQLKDVRLPGIKSIEWKSNTVYDADENLSGGIFLRVTDETSIYEPIAGGVFDLQLVDGPPPASWTNTNNRWDVNANDSITAVDALVIINFLNRNPTGTLPDFSSGENPPPYYDVDGNGIATPIDALSVINYINRSGEGEGERKSSSMSETELAVTSHAGLDVCFALWDFEDLNKDKRLWNLELEVK